MTKRIKKSPFRPRGRNDLIREAVTILRILEKQSPTVQELSAMTGYHSRKVYRILGALKEAGETIEVEEDPRTQGAGKPTRRYYIAIK